MLATTQPWMGPEGPGDRSAWIQGLGVIIINLPNLWAVTQITACVVLIMYLTGHLRFDKLVHTVMWLTALWLAVIGAVSLALFTAWVSNVRDDPA